MDNGLVLAGWDFQSIFEHLPRLLTELAAIYYAVKFGTKHGKAG